MAESDQKGPVRVGDVVAGKYRVEHVGGIGGSTRRFTFTSSRSGSQIHPPGRARQRALEGALPPRGARGHPLEERARGAGARRGDARDRRALSGDGFGISKTTGPAGGTLATFGGTKNSKPAPKIEKRTFGGGVIAGAAMAAVLGTAGFFMRPRVAMAPSPPPRAQRR